MPRHTDPTTISYADGHFIGEAGTRPFNPDNRVSNALRDRLLGMTWREVADRHGYRSARAAEHNVGRFVAVLNGQRSTRTATATAGAMSTRRFGVEIEFQGCTMAAAAAALTDEFGYDVRRASYHSSRTYDAWRVEHDGSVTTSRGTGGEAVSPVLSGADGIEQVKRACAAIRRAGGRVSVSCGIHVHIDARDLTGEHLARLVEAYESRTVEVFDRLVAPSRRSTTWNRTSYCAPMNVHEKERNKEALKAGQRTGFNARYRNVNLAALGRIGTLEFRQHHGSLNGTKITSWVKMLLALTNAVVATADEDLPDTAADFIEALEPHGLDRRAITHLTRRAAAAA